MSYKQSAFLFDYIDFMAAIDPIVHDLDKSNTESLRSIVEQIRNRIPNEQEWILHDIGTRLRGNFGLDKDYKYRNGLTGHWLLIVLSTFLLPVQSLEYGWSMFSRTLYDLKWEHEERHLILKGSPTSLLIKPELPPLGRAVKWEDQYWYWVMPLYSVYNGWLSLDQSIRLLKHLESDKQRIDNHQKDGYSIATQLLLRSIETKKGLFIVVYEEDN
jgi:hypothetical protein